MFYYLTINIGQLQFFITSNGLLPAKNFIKGFFVDDPITIIWLSLASLLIIDAVFPVRNLWSYGILDRRNNFLNHTTALLSFSSMLSVSLIVIAWMGTSKAWAILTPYLMAFFVFGELFTAINILYFLFKLKLLTTKTVSYTHLTLPTICSV